jgi:hypothetical protein
VRDQEWFILEAVAELETEPHIGKRFVGLVQDAQSRGAAGEFLRRPFEDGKMRQEDSGQWRIIVGNREAPPCLVKAGKKRD